ncbi:MAG: AAA family ATPase [Treponema sp.]|jgi:exonuclease SbcC|nr:AAA family ATPase [Treponema sp.]
MKPELLRLENFGPFVGEVCIDFNALDDIFLITGKTGSGKTTIFDALCFALYGKVPGSRGGHLARLRSDHVGEDQECSVSLCFSVGERHYRIDRTPRQEKPKKRGTGTAIAEETAVLYEMVQGKPVNPSARKSEADQKIRELIGLQAEEFFKIVLLPQGDFAEFLKQNTNERKEVLGKLFPIEKAIRIKELAQEKARDAVAEAREAERVLGDVAKRVSLDTLEAIRAQATEAWEKAKAQVAAIAAESILLTRILELKQREQDLAGRLRSIQAEAAQHNAETGAIQDQEARLSRSRKAQPLKEYVVLEAEKCKEAEQAERELERAHAYTAQAQQAAQEADAQGKAITALEQAVREFQEKRPLLLEINREAELLRRNIQEAAACKAQCLELSKKKEVLEKNHTLQQQELQKLQARSEGLETLDAQWEALRDSKDTLLHLKTLAEEAGALRTEEGALQSRISAGEVGQQELSQRIPVLGTALQELEQEKDTGERADMAAHLAATLIPGEPCPVCGSQTHPCLAVPVRGVFGMDQRIESLAHALKDAERDAAIQETALEAQDQELRKVRRRLEELQKIAAQVKEASLSAGDPALAACFPSGNVLPDTLEVSRLLKTRLTLLQELSFRRNEARKAGALVPGLYGTLRELEGVLGKTEQDYAVMAEKHRGLVAAIEDLQQKHRRILGEQGFGERGESGGKEALRVLEQAIQEREQQIKAYREAREQAGRELAGAGARETAARISRDGAVKKYQEAAAALEEALASSPFATKEELKGAILSPDRAEAMETAITRWREAGTRIESLMAELETSLEQLRSEVAALGSAGEADPGTLRLKLEALAQAQEQAELQRDRAQGELLTLERDAALFQEATERYKILADKSGRLNALATDLAGKNPKKRSFDAWLLGLYLAEVAAFATKRLERMSESRYALILDMQRESGRGLTGLDLAVFDGYTGKTRPCATLSGGESFMASISLALGLADSIQARSGGVRLDAVFIDEGFGSLDEGSLDKALVILDELRDHRMVGLISHVGELRSRIPCRIEVIKSRAGSFLCTSQGG